MQSRIGSTTLSQLAFLGESNLIFPREKSQWDNTLVNCKNANASMFSAVADLAQGTPEWWEKMKEPMSAADEELLGFRTALKES